MSLSQSAKELSRTGNSNSLILSKDSLLNFASQIRLSYQNSKPAMSLHPLAPLPDHEKLENSLYFSLLVGNFGLETGSLVTASSAIQSRFTPTRATMAAKRGLLRSGS